MRKRIVIKYLEKLADELLDSIEDYIPIETQELIVERVHNIRDIKLMIETGNLERRG